MRVVEALAAAVAAEQVPAAFCLPDDVTIHVAHALSGAGIRLVRARHEQNAVAMADGYARATGGPAVCAVGGGPALAQTGTGLMTAVRRRSPVLVLVGGTDPMRGNVKRFDARRFVESTGARFVATRGPAWVAEDVHEAFRLVHLGRGPVVLELPYVEEIHEELVGPWHYRPARDAVARPVELDPGSDLIDELAGMLAWARKPIIVAGRGAATADAGAAVRSLADRIGALVATSLQSRELFRDHPRNIGIVGTYGTDTTVELLAEADCILALGVALNAYQTGGGTVAANARVIHVDTDPEAIGAIARADVAVVADAGAVARALGRALAQADMERPSAWADDPRIATAADLGADLPPAPPHPDGRAPMTPILRRLDELLPADRVVIADAGDFLLYTVDEITVPDPGSWVWTADFGSIGMGLPVALGTAVAHPDRPCVLFAGDGGFMVSIQELETAVRERIPLRIVVLNDCAYRPEVRFMEAYGKPGDAGRFHEVDFAAVARGFGLAAATVRGVADLEAAAPLLAEHDGPVLLDAKVSGLERHRSFAAAPSAAPEAG